MKTRLNYYGAAPETIKALVALETHLANSGLEASLFHLVKTRASQINGCAYCIHMHTKDARAHGDGGEYGKKQSRGSDNATHIHELNSDVGKVAGWNTTPDFAPGPSMPGPSMTET